jgi:hypothetical protein
VVIGNMRASGFALLMAFAAPVAAVGQEPSRPAIADELRGLLDAALYPIQIMSFCYRAVDQNRDFQTAGIDWFVRNGPTLDALKTLAADAGIPDAERIEAELRSTEAIAAEIAGQPDGAAYCRAVAKSTDYGKFDLINIPDDLKPLLKRFFP